MGDEHISLELRAVEQTFDNAYRSNPLLGAQRTTATWTLLSVFEDMIALPLLGPNSANVQTSSHRENLLINGLKHALRWVRECPTDGRLQSRYNDDRYGHASDLLMLGSRYDTIVTIFTYANRGYCNLTLDGDCVVPAPLIDAEDACYYAYNRFLQADSEPWSPPSTDLLRLLDEIAESVIVLDHGFRVPITPRLIAKVTQEQRPAIDRRFQLPGDWCTTRYSFADFQSVYSAFSAIAAVHLNARLIAVQRGAESLGFDGAVIIYNVNELHSRIRRYTRLGGDTISAVVEDLTYGSRGVSSPDPALQPLVPVGNDTLLISPSLILCSSPERNHCVLLNSIPAERKVYAALVDRKEAITRKRIVAATAGKGYRSYHGMAAGHQIDLALIDDRSEAVLILELKWFIGPDEVGEILARNEELRAGVCQVKTRLSAFGDGTVAIQTRLGVASSFKFSGAVVSQNWIGSWAVQDKAVPIVSLCHFEKALVEFDTLTAVSDWLTSRTYLPVENIHFSIRRGEVRVGDHGAVWWDIESLISGPYEAGLDSGTNSHSPC
jgi:hypothetical protein